MGRGSALPIHTGASFLLLSCVISGLPLRASPTSPLRWVHILFPYQYMDWSTNHCNRFALLRPRVPWQRPCCRWVKQSWHLQTSKTQSDHSSIANGTGKPISEWSPNHNGTVWNYRYWQQFTASQNRQKHSCQNRILQQAHTLCSFKPQCNMPTGITPWYRVQ